MPDYAPPPTSLTAFPLARFQRAGATNAQITALQTWWNTLNATQQAAQVKAIQAMHDSQVVAIMQAGSNAATQTIGDARSNNSGVLPPFQAFTFYPQGFAIQQAAHLYVAKVAFTSGAAFVAADWLQVGG